MASKNFVLGVYDDEDAVVRAVKSVRAEGLKIHEVYTPFPIHGLDHALGYERPRMGVAAFLFGMTGTICALLLTIWTMGIDWRINVGGKNFIPFPTNIPITFELTVLLAAFGMAFTFFYMEDLGPTKKAIIFDERSTDDKFIIAVNTGKNVKSEAEIEASLKSSGAIEVNKKTV